MKNYSPARKTLFLSFLISLFCNSLFSQVFEDKKVTITHKGIFNTNIYNYPLQFFDLDNDGDFDLFGSTDMGTVIIQNIGDSVTPVFAATKQHPYGIKKMFYPTFADIDGDGDLDAIGMQFSGGFAYKSHVVWSENTGTITNPAFSSTVKLDLGLAKNFTYLRFVDIDGDGDLDVFGINKTGGGVKDSHVAFQENTGTAKAPHFGELQYAPFKLIELSTAAIDFIDIDNDGDLDAYFTASTKETGGKCFIQKNVGSSVSPEFGNPQYNFSGLAGSYTMMLFVDIDADEQLEVVGTSMYGYFYQNIIKIDEE